MINNKMINPKSWLNVPQLTVSMICTDYVLCLCFVALTILFLHIFFFRTIMCLLSFNLVLQIIRSPCDVINKNDVNYLWEAGVHCERIQVRRT